MFSFGKVWDFLVLETNRYAAQCRGAQRPTRADSRRPWHDVTLEEMRAVILPTIEMYWSQKHLLLSQPLMTISRYLLLVTWL